jgi:hypothetical protein
VRGLEEAHIQKSAFLLLWRRGPAASTTGRGSGRSRRHICIWIDPGMLLPERAALRRATGSAREGCQWKQTMHMRDHGGREKQKD